MQAVVGSVRVEKAVSSQRPVRYPVRFATNLLAGDALMLVLSTFIAALILIRFGHRTIEPLAAITSTVASGSLWIAVFAYAGFYRRSFAVSWHDEYYWVAAVSALAIAPQLILYTLLPQISTSRLLLLVTIPINILVIGTFRAALRRWCDRKGRLRPRIAFLGGPRDVQAAENRFGFADGVDTFLIPVPGWPDGTGLHEATKERCEGWFWSARQWGADRLVVTRVPSRKVLKTMVAAAARQRLQIAFASREILSGSGEFEIEHLGGEPVLVPVLPSGCNASADVSKSIIDLTFAIVGLAIFWPVMLVVAIAIYLESGGPVLYRQERIGQDGSVFHILKFRSMRKDAESATGAVWAKSNDARVTKVGRFLRRTSLDELPQIFNVLRGQMSIVGPRPERPVFVEHFRDAIDRYDERHLVRPGITGLSHVHMNRDVDQSAIGQRLEYDLFYIEHWSPMMDLSIVFKTGCEFLLHRIAT
jgi:exopolysaccharide biosynthesis polyprenyl glycosylphosphotransferase